MSDAEKIALINQLPAIIAGCVAAVGAILGFINKSKIQEVHLALNSRVDELVTASRDAGRIAERSDQATAATAKAESQRPLSGSQ